MTEKITIEGVIKSAIDSRVLDIHTAIPCIVESVGGSTVDVTVAIKRVLLNREALTVPVIPDVPVLFMGSSSASISFNISAGDEGMIIFSERDISSFIERGVVSPPIEFRDHEYSDAVFIPANLSKSRAKAIPSSGIEIEGEVKIIGGLQVTGEVTAMSEGSSVTLSQHTHIDSQGGQTQPPTAGT